MSKDILVNGTFHSDINYIFESYLKKEDEAKVLIMNTDTGEVVMKMNYDKVVFDSELNIYKKTDQGLEKVDKPNFKAVVVKR